MLQAIGKHAQGQGLRVHPRLVFSHPLGQDARKLCDLGNPASIFFLLRLNGPLHPISS